MPIKSKVFIQIVQKSQNRHKISFAIEFNNKNTKKVFGPIQLSWIYPPLQLGLTASCFYNSRRFARPYVPNPQHFGICLSNRASQKKCLCLAHLKGFNLLPQCLVFKLKYFLSFRFYTKNVGTDCQPYFYMHVCQCLFIGFSFYVAVLW